MITFDGEYSVIAHFEITEDEALEHGGLTVGSLKHSVNKLTDYMLAGIFDRIALGDNDFIAINPVERELIMGDEEIELDDENQEISSEVEEIVKRNSEKEVTEDEQNKNEV